MDGLSGGSRTLTAFAQLGAGAAVPRARRVGHDHGGFGLAGAALRRRRTAVA